MNDFKKSIKDVLRPDKGKISGTAFVIAGSAVFDKIYSTGGFSHFGFPLPFYHTIRGPTAEWVSWRSSIHGFWPEFLLINIIIWYLSGIAVHKMYTKIKKVRT